MSQQAAIMLLGTHCFSNDYPRCKRFGLEQEVFKKGKKKKLKWEKLIDKGDPHTCLVKGEAGEDQFELITSPFSSLKEACGVMSEQAIKIAPVFFTPFRPEGFPPAVWRSDPRYDALRASLEMEVPGMSHLVDQMTTHAALHVNVSGGSVNPFSEAGVFLVNMINHMAPYIAMMVHNALGFGKGHLALYKGYANPGRLPEAGRWFRNLREMVAHIQSLRKLFYLDASGKPVVYPKINMSVSDPLDLTFLWWFLRPKISPRRESYLEIRYLPSMPMEEVEKYASLVVNVIESLLEWFYVQNEGRPVKTIAGARDAFTFLYQGGLLNRVTPLEPLTDDKWENFLLVA